MAYPEDLDSKYNLRDYNFAVNDNDKLPYDENQFKKGYRNADESATDSVPDAHNVNWIYDILYANLRYTKDTAIENKNLIANKKATTTSLGQIKVGQGLKVLSDGTLTLENPISGDKQSITYDIPVGMFMLWGANSNIPEGFIEPIGQTITKTVYPELFEWATTNHSSQGIFSGFFSGTVSSNQCTLVDMRGKFIKIAENDGVGTYEGDGIPTLTITSSNHTHSGTTNAGTAHRHGVGTLSYNATGWLKRLLINENKNFSSSGCLYISDNTASSSATSDWGFEGDSYGRTCTLNLNTSTSRGASWSGQMDTESSHTHTFSITSSGGHTHDLTYPSGLTKRNDTRVVPANYGFKLILKAKPSQPVRTVPIGTILDYSGTSAPDGFLIARGLTCLISDYRDLYDWAIENDLMKEYSEYQAGKPHSCYYKANNNIEFIIPNLIGVYRRSETTNVGAYEEDGAPNIQGYFYADSTPVVSGVYNNTTTQSQTSGRGFITNTLNQPIQVNFNASNSNQCYGRTSYIQPKTVRTLPILKW